MTDNLDHILAKSRPPETLVAHLAATLTAARKLRQRVGDLRFLPEDLRPRFWDIVEMAAVAHDLGKIPDGFQAVLCGRSPYWAQRHEIVSLGWLRSMVGDDSDREWIAAGIATHHRAITGESESKPTLATLYGGMDESTLRAGIAAVSVAGVEGISRWLAAAHSGFGDNVVNDPVKDAFDELQRLFVRWRRVSPEVGLAAIMLQAAVTTADHLASAHGDLDIAQPLDGDHVRGLVDRMNGSDRPLKPHQTTILDTMSEHVIVRSPTGSGKTITAQLWIGRQVDAIAAATGGSPRVLWTLPYLASINAAVGTLGGTRDGVGKADAVGAAHSRSATYYFHVDNCDEGEDGQGAARMSADRARKAVARRQATQLFNEAIRVTTPYQLLRGALAGPAHSGILLDAANSVFVFDELHAYEPRRLGFILAMMRFLHHIGSRICVLSATMPDLLLELLGECLPGITTIEGHGSGYPARHRLHIHDPHLTDATTIDAIRRRINAGDAVLVVANNVADAQTLHAELGPDARRIHGNDAASILLHSRFKRVDRADIEKILIERYRTGESRCGGLVIATQCVEVSLDIDMDTMFTSAATLEAIMQRMGRVNRVAARPPADIHIHHPEYRQRRKNNPSEYADGVYDKESVAAAMNILQRHDDAVVDETDITAWLNEIYSGQFGVAWTEQVRTADRDFTKTLLNFRKPFEARDALREQFDSMFEGKEAVLSEDRESYAALLASPGGKRAGRLLASDLLIPLPSWAPTTWDKELKVYVVNGDYDPELGLTEVHREPNNPNQWYESGEVF